MVPHRPFTVARGLEQSFVPAISSEARTCDAGRFGWRAGHLRGVDTGRDRWDRCAWLHGCVGFGGDARVWVLGSTPFSLVRGFSPVGAGRTIKPNVLPCFVVLLALLSGFTSSPFVT